MTHYADVNESACFDDTSRNAITDDPAHRAKLIRQLRERHWTMLGLATAIVVGAFALQTNEAGRVATSWWPNLPLPVLCGSRMWFGLECPGCGLTRSIIALAGGDIVESFRLHHLGWLMALAVVLQFPYRIILLKELPHKVVERIWPTWFGWALIGILIFNWLGKVAPIW